MHASLDLVRGNYPQIAHKLLRPLVQFLATCHGLCGGDVEKGLILLVIACRTAQHPEFRNLLPDGLNSQEIFPSLGVNVRSISESTGIPRENVRRKVNEAIEAGWLVREGRDLLFTAAGYRALEPAKLELERLAAEIHSAVEGAGSQSGG